MDVNEIPEFSVHNRRILMQGQIQDLWKEGLTAR